jgi:hypothetical protein
VFHVPFEIWIAILKRREILEVIALNGRIMFECTFEEVILEYVDCISLALNVDP